jgi:hypothetical protein
MWQYLPDCPNQAPFISSETLILQLGGRAELALALDRAVREKAPAGWSSGPPQCGKKPKQKVEGSHK